MSLPAAGLQVSIFVVIMSAGMACRQAWLHHEIAMTVCLVFVVLGVMGVGFFTVEMANRAFRGKP
jgi:hypothetical protein